MLNKISYYRIKKCISKIRNLKIKESHMGNNLSSGKKFLNNTTFTDINREVRRHENQIMFLWKERHINI